MYYNALFDVPNEDGKLRIDMTAQVYIVLNEARNALTIPASAIQASNRPQRSANAAPRPERSERPSEERPQGQRPTRLEINAAEKALIEQGKASLAMVRVLQADGTAKPQQVLIGLNNRANAQVIRGLKLGDQVVIADPTDTSNDAAKRNTSRAGAGGPPMRM